MISDMKIFLWLESFQKQRRNDRLQRKSRNKQGKNKFLLNIAFAAGIAIQKSEHRNRIYALRFAVRIVCINMYFFSKA